MPDLLFTKRDKLRHFGIFFGVGVIFGGWVLVFGFAKYNTYMYVCVPAT